MTHLDKLPRRVFGIETEYGVLAAAKYGGRCVLDADTLGREIFFPILSTTQSTSAFLENGGRLYLDTGSHPEYATAECSSLTDVLAQDRAGGKILVDMAAAASDRLSKKTGTELNVHLFKNNLDSAGNSCGCHENFLLYRSSNFRALVDSLVSFLVSRQIFCGTGALLKINGETNFCLSQRAFQIDDAVSAATTTTRPLVNTRDEPLADAKHFRRLHVIVGDSNVLESPTRFKMATMNLLLAALESGEDLSDLQLDSPVAALQTLTQDITGMYSKAVLRDGRRFSALDLQEEFLTRMQKVFAHAELDEVYREVFQEWQTWIYLLRNSRLSDLVGILDWSTKYHILDKLRFRESWEWGDPRVSRADLAYHDLSSAGLHLDSRGLGKRITTEEQVDLALTTPPNTTRACLRGGFISDARKHRADLQVDWTHLRIPGAPGGTVILSDPFALSDPGVDRLRNYMEEL